MCSWAREIASISTSSFTSHAPPSTMVMELSVPAISRSSIPLSVSSSVGNTLSLPSTIPTRTAATGSAKGIEESPKAHDAAVIASTSASKSSSAEMTVAIICTSLR
jgi:hypothetical protein